MQVTNVDVTGRVVPLADDFPVSYEAHTGTEHALVRIETDGDAVGYGEGTALPWFTGESTAGMVEIVDRWIAPRIEGKSLAEAANTLMAFGDRFPNAPGATAAVELALLDLEGKRLTAPVSALLGPRERDSIPVIFVVPGLAPDAAAARVADAVNAGFRHFKVKANGDGTRDAERINAVLDELPAEGTLRIDANTGWHDFSTAKYAIDKIAALDQVEYFEQPLAADRPADMRALWDATGVPVFADESVHCPADLEQLGSDNVIAGCQLKLAKTGSLRGLRDLASVARRHDIRVSPVSAFGMSLEAAAIIHLASVVTPLTAGIELCMDLLAEDVAEPAVAFAPAVEVPSGPGLGVELPDQVFE